MKKSCGSRGEKDPSGSQSQPASLLETTCDLAQSLPLNIEQGENRADKEIIPLGTKTSSGRSRFLAKAHFPTGRQEGGNCTNMFRGGQRPATV